MRIGLGMSIVGGGYAPSGITYLSDVGGTPTAAYSVRKVVSDYSGSAIRVRESSGDTETDIGFDGEGLDEAALLAHCGANDGFVTKWYDQSGSGYDAVQDTAGSQPKIVSAGTVIKENGLPALDFDGTDDRFTATVTGIRNATNLSTFIASRPDLAAAADTTTHVLFGYGDGGGITEERGFSYGVSTSIVNGETLCFFFDNSLVNSNRLGSSTYSRSANTHILSSLFNLSSGTSVYENGSGILFNISYQMTTSTDTSPSNADIASDAIHINSMNGTNAGPSALFQEVIFYASDKSSLRTDIEGNINDYYSIYP